MKHSRHTTAMHLLQSGVSMAAKKGASLAGRKGPPVRLRYGLWQRDQGRNSTIARLREPAELPAGNSGCPAATVRLLRTAMEAVIRIAITRSCSPKCLLVSRKIFLNPGII